MQIPYEHSKSLEFIKYIKRHYKVPDENMLNSGDECDEYWGSMYKKNPDASHTANQEIEECRDKLKKWYDAFPLMKLCTSNHGDRWKRKAIDAEIPSQLLRGYEEMIQAPKGWKWAKKWVIPTKRPFCMVHGDDWGSQTPHIQAAMHLGMSVVMGHHHTLAGVHFIRTEGFNIWGAVGGSLIDFESYAFDYAKNAKRKPCIGSFVIANHGAMPIWIPLE